MTNQEAIEMMDRCRQEIISLRLAVNALKPKAEAYDNLSIILNLLPKRNIEMGEDLVWVLNKRIKDLQDHERG